MVSPEPPGVKEAMDRVARKGSAEGPYLDRSVSLKACMIRLTRLEHDYAEIKARLAEIVRAYAQAGDDLDA